jgi:hypothetical protein
VVAGAGGRRCGQVVAPLVWLGAVTIRFLARELADFTPAEVTFFDSQTFRAPQQLALYERNPTLVTAGYALFALASVLLVPAMVTLATRAAIGSPLLATIGGTLVGGVHGGAQEQRLGHSRRRSGPLCGVAARRNPATSTDCGRSA